MSEEERRTAYNSTRILIEASRVLNPQFNNGVLYISGAQIEMLRNVVQYLGRMTTFVDTYHEGYYIMPDDDDWDIIVAIVADLENVIMGNDNTVFGYNEQLEESLGGVLTSGTTFSKWTPLVQAGEVWVVQVVSVKSKDTDPTVCEILVDTGVTNWELAKEFSPGIEVPVIAPITFALAEGKRVGVRFTDCLVGDLFSGYVWGYKMQVPT